ncbi:MAG: RDD family protein [Anaerolineales bacterium]|nr:RDD family protein [Anaerolineales bacterium]
MARSNRGLIGQYAGFFSRAVALIIDIILISVSVILINALIALPVTFFLQIDPQTCTREIALARTYEQLICQGINIIWVMVALLAAPVYFTFFFSTTGQTIGKYVMGVRVVRTDGRQMSILGSLGRWFGYFVSLIPLGVGFLWVTLDDRRQGWHDKLSHTVVVYAWRAEQDEFLLDRLRRYFKRRHDVAGALDAVAIKSKLDASLYDLVTITFGEYDRLNQILGMMQDAVAKGQLEVVNATVLVKDVDGSVSVVGTSDLAVGNDPVMFGGEDSHIPDYELQPVMQDIPPDNFVIAVVLTESSADNLTKMVARRTAAAIRRYDLGDNPNNVSVIQAPVTSAQPVQSAPAPTASQIAQRQQTTIAPLPQAAVAYPATTTAPTLATASSGGQTIPPGSAQKAVETPRLSDPVVATAAPRTEAIVYSASEVVVIEDGEVSESIDTVAVTEVALADGTSAQEVEAAVIETATQVVESATAATTGVVATSKSKSKSSTSTRAKSGGSASATPTKSATGQTAPETTLASATSVGTPSATKSTKSTKPAKAPVSEPATGKTASASNTSGSVSSSKSTKTAKPTKVTAKKTESSAPIPAPMAATSASAALEAERAAEEAAEAAKAAIQAAQDAIAAAQEAAEAARIAARESAA